MQHFTYHRGTDGFALLALVLMVVGFLAICCMVSVQRLTLMVKMCGEDKSFIQAHYLAETAKARAIYYLYDNRGLGGSFEKSVNELFVENILIGTYIYEIENCSMADRFYRIDIDAFYYPPFADSHAAEVAIAVYVNDSGGDFKFTPVTEFIKYRR